LLTLGTVIFIRPQQIFFSPHGIFKGFVCFFFVFVFVSVYFVWVSVLWVYVGIDIYILQLSCCFSVYVSQTHCRFVYGRRLKVVVIVVLMFQYSHILFYHLCNFEHNFKHAPTHKTTHETTPKKK